MMGCYIYLIPVMIDRKATGTITAFLLLLITFDAFQQKFYIDTFDLMPEGISLATLIRSHILRWTIWAFMGVAFAYVSWIKMRSGSTPGGLKSILYTGTTILPFLLAAIAVISLSSILGSGHALVINNFIEAFTFFFFQKGITFFMAFAALSLYLHTLLQAKKINAQWVELNNLRRHKTGQRVVEQPDTHPYISIRIGYQVRPIPVSDINWIQADDYCVKIHTSTNSYCLRKSMKFLEKELSPFRFVRVHRGALLNLQFIDKVNFDSSTVKLQNNAELPLSKSGQQLLRKKINQHSI